MAKNGAGGALGGKVKTGKAKKNGHNKPKRGKMFKALKKQEHRRVHTLSCWDKATGTKSATAQTPAAKRRSAISNEFRNFDERMAGQKTKQQQQQRSLAAATKPVIAPPTFVVAAPTFQLNAESQSTAAPPQPDARGFEGFLSAMQAPRDARTVPVDHPARKPKPVQPQYSAQNVFAVLNEEEEAEERRLQQAPAFIQPATFSFASPTPAFTLPQRQVVADIDPDL